MRTPVRNEISQVARLLLLAGALLPSMALFAPGPVGAQTPAGEAAPAPQMVSEVVVRFRGARNVSDEVVQANLQQKAGAPYDQILVDRSIRSLYGTGLFEFIDVQLESTGPNALRVIFEVQGKLRVGTLEFEGNRKVRDGTLEREILSSRGRALDDRLLSTDREKIRTYYRERGWDKVQVDFRVDRTGLPGFADVTFVIDEGKRYRITELEFAGNDAVRARKLRGQMKTKRWGMWSWLTGNGRFKDGDFNEDLDKLRDYYRNLGYLDIELDEANIDLSYTERGGIELLIPVSEGRQYRVGDIFFEENKLFPSEILGSFLRLRTGDPFSPEKLDKDVETITDFYGNYGYLDARIRPVRKANLQTGAIDLTYRVEEGDRFFVETVNIEGNTTTRSTVIIRELALAPGDIFNLVRMKTSEARLVNTRFFEERGVNLNPEPTNIPLRRNLKVSVEEGRTGNFTFGAGFSSLENVVIFFELTQGNFDLFAWRSFFQGDGQKFRLRLSLGQESSEFIIAFEEPWLFEQQLTFGFEIFRTTSDFVSDLYDETRAGFEVYLRKRIYELWEGRLTYRFENVSLQGSFNQDFTVSKVTGALVRDTRNSLLYPTRGNRALLVNEYAGIGGDLEFIRYEAQFSQFIPTFELGDQSIGILGRIGTIWPYSDQELRDFAPSELYYLGGPRTLRGFEFRDVGPKDAFGNPLGGNSMGFLTIEYTVKLADPLRFAIFYDWGFVNEDEFDYSPVNFNDNWGVGLRILVLGAPMALDYGLPLTADDSNDQGGQFYFSFGTRF